VEKQVPALGGTVGGKKVSSRYVGALVADVHNVLINGGIYGYPATRDNANGKLRLLYESAPMAMIMEQAGGAGSTGRGRILDVLPPQRKNVGHSKDVESNDEEAGKGIHVRVPTYLGSVENVYELHNLAAGNTNTAKVSISKTLQKIPGIRINLNSLLLIQGTDLRNEIKTTLTLFLLQFQRDVAYGALLDALHQMCGESSDLIAHALGRQDGDLIDNALVGVEVQRQARVVLLDNGAG